MHVYGLGFSVYKLTCFQTPKSNTETTQTQPSWIPITHRFDISTPQVDFNVSSDFGVSIKYIHIYIYIYMYIYSIYRMAGNFGGKIFWRIAENMSFGGIYFGG